MSRLRRLTAGWIINFALINSKIVSWQEDNTYCLLLPPFPFIRRTRILRFKLFHLSQIIWLLIFYFYNVNFIWLDSSSNMLYHDYKFITINDITFEKWMVKVLFGRPCHVLVCLINVEGGSIQIQFCLYS